MLSCHVRINENVIQVCGVLLSILFMHIFRRHNKHPIESQQWAPIHVLWWAILRRVYQLSHVLSKHMFLVIAGYRNRKWHCSNIRLFEFDHQWGTNHSGNSAKNLSSNFYRYSTKNPSVNSVQRFNLDSFHSKFISRILPRILPTILSRMKEILTKFFLSKIFLGILTFFFQNVP